MQGAMHEHIQWALIQCNMWQQLLIACINKGSTSSRMSPGDGMVKCGCVTSLCSRHCSSKDNNVPCTELCACEADPVHCANNADDNAADSDISDIDV